MQRTHERHAGRSSRHRVGCQRRRGYERKTFENAWERYLDPLQQQQLELDDEEALGRSVARSSDL